MLQPSRLCTREAPYCTYICATTYPYTCPTHYYYCPTRTPACFYQQQVAMAAGGAMAQPMAAQAIHVTLNVLCHITHGGPECPVQTVEPNCVTQLRGCGLPAGGQTFAACTQVCGAGFPGQGYDPYAGYYGT
ncbi:MAG: hypothetical protein JO264_16530 [Acidisphaera sp.]|nr:hypothetical protein [Acidisphaera sp.]